MFIVTNRRLYPVNVCFSEVILRKISKMYDCFVLRFPHELHALVYLAFARCHFNVIFMDPDCQGLVKIYSPRGIHGIPISGWFGVLPCVLAVGIET